MKLFASPNTDDFEDPFKTLDLSSKGDTSMKEEIDMFSTQMVLKDLNTEFDLYLKKYSKIFNHNLFKKFFEFISETNYAIASYFFLLKEYSLFDILFSKLNDQDLPNEEKDIIQDMVYFSCIQFLRTHRNENRIKFMSFQTCSIKRMVEILIEKYENKKEKYLGGIKK